MSEGTISISSQDQLKNCSATMEMVFFSLMSGQADSKLIGFIDMGLSICDIVTKGPMLSNSAVANYRDFAKAEAFRALDRKTQACPGKLSDLEQEARVVKQTLEKIKAGKRTSEKEMDASATFFSRIYRAM